ncbi:MAG: hypothetical protein A2020_03715 [Lentisphaerae bacterium GWF2_45_14]|nr:MAG: hypothetical protein A2020_03715 [Lentisphaerae bacterium GWF2_45_14]
MIKILKAFALLLFAAGLLFSAWAAIGLSIYFTAQNENRLPPAGEFIKGPDSFSFAVISDSGMRDEPLDLILKEIKTKDIKFIFHLGDQARALSINHFEYLLQFLDARLGDIPFYAVPGNHDITKSGRTSSLYYKRAFGQMNYYFSYGSTLFVILNTADGRFGKEQQIWLEGTLARLRNGFKNCVVLMHVPPVDPRPNEKYAMEGDINELQAILTKYKITCIIAGHIHEYNEGAFAGIPLYIAPPSGQKMRGNTQKYGYLLCGIDKADKLSIKKIDVTNKLGRNYLMAALATDLDGIKSAIIAFACLIASFVTIFAAASLAGKKVKSS